MENWISTACAGNALLVLLSGLGVFHLLVLAGRIPYDLVWAGRIQTRRELVRLEIISLLIVVVAIVVVALRMGYLTFVRHAVLLQAAMWVLFAFFLLNTLGNATAKNPIEKYGFGLLTLLLALLALRLALAP